MALVYCSLVHANALLHSAPVLLCRLLVPGAGKSSRQGGAALQTTRKTIMPPTTTTATATTATARSGSCSCRRWVHWHVILVCFCFSFARWHEEEDGDDDDDDDDVMVMWWCDDDDDDHHDNSDDDDDDDDDDGDAVFSSFLSLQSEKKAELLKKHTAELTVSKVMNRFACR
jgi:hypothetical protein